MWKNFMYFGGILCRFLYEVKSALILRHAVGLIVSYMAWRWLVAARMPGSSPPESQNDSKTASVTGPMGCENVS
jgi:hypothetical protein